MAVGQGQEKRFLPLRSKRFLIGRDGQSDVRGVNAKRRSKQGRHSPAGKSGTCDAQLRFKGHKVTAELNWRPGAELPKNGNALLHQTRDLHRKFVGTAELVEQHLSAVGLA